ncbi:MAG: helix-turn-helix transcriptional regulator [Planctomycetota bacterium]
MNTHGTSKDVHVYLKMRSEPHLYMGSMVAMSLSTFGERLKTAREYRGISQADLANSAGIRTNTVSSYERGTGTNPRSDTIAALARALDVSAAWLGFGDPEATPDWAGQRTVAPVSSAHANVQRAYLAKDYPDWVLAAIPAELRDPRAQYTYGDLINFLDAVEGAGSRVFESISPKIVSNNQ